MNKENRDIKEVKLAELNENLLIVAYTGLDDKYKQIDEKILEWLQLNFRNTQTRVSRKDKMLELLIDQIQIGDTLLEISHFPDSLKKLTAVNKSLIKELKNRGFTSFKVKKFKRPSEKKEKLKIATDKANKLVEEIAENVEIRNEATEAIEYFIDNARKGVVSEKEIKGFIDDMIDKTSSDAISAIASLKKSDQTYGHCVDVSGIFNNVYSGIISRKKKKSIFKDNKESSFAGFMHDFGKAKVPKEVLDSVVRFEVDSPEMELIRSHPQNGLDLLMEMKQPDYILNIVLNHHVKLDPTINSSYPKNIKYDDVIWETRLLSIVDVYQALIGKRSYKRSWSPPAAIRYLDAMADVEFDQSVWEDFMQIIGAYPVSSLVELSDGSAAFVMNVPEEELERPQVVVVQSADGKSVENHTLLNLQDELDVAITKDLDAQDFFGEKALDIFTKIKLN